MRLYNALVISVLLHVRLVLEYTLPLPSTI